MKQAIALGLVLGLVACDENPTPTKEATPSPTATNATTATGGATTATAATAAKGPFPTSTHPAMKDPSLAKDEAPAKFTAKFDTTAGAFEVECTREWAPSGVDRFYNLVKIGFYDDVAFFRAVKGFMVQFGIHGDPEVSKHWSSANIDPDEVKQSNKRGMVTFAQAGRPAGQGLTASARSTQIFINYADNDRLDGMGFAPICKVSKGMDVVDKIHQGYGEAPSREQPILQSKGNAHLREKYPELDYIKTAKIVSEGEGEGGAGAGEGGAAAGEGGAKAETDAKADDAKAGEEKAAPGKAEGKATEGKGTEGTAPKGTAPKGTGATPPPAPKGAAPGGPGKGEGKGQGSGQGDGSGKGDGSGQGG